MMGTGGERGSGISVQMAQHDDDDGYLNLGSNLAQCCFKSIS